MANVFKPMMARGELNLIGATTLNEYQKYIEKDAALERRFQPVTVPEPTVAQAIMILRGLRDTFEAHHKVSISEDAIIAAAELSDRYITARFLPDKAIDLLDQAAARVKLSATAGRWPCRSWSPNCTSCGVNRITWPRAAVRPGRRAREAHRSQGGRAQEARRGLGAGAGLRQCRGQGGTRGADRLAP